MTGDKKIVGLWRESAADQDTKASAEAAPAGPAAEEAAPASDWLDMSALEDADLSEDTALPPAPTARRDRVITLLLAALALGWTGWAAASATGGLARAPSAEEWPPFIATLAMPLTLLVLLWSLLLRSGNSEQARLMRVSEALRQENAALNASMRALAAHLSEAQRQLSEQARTIQQLGADTVSRLNESSDRLASNASVIANANDQLARSGDVALQRMDGLLAGLPRIDDVAQRLAVNFREAGLVAHQQGASLEAQLAALGEESTRAARAGQEAAAGLHEAIGALQSQAGEASGELKSVVADLNDTQSLVLAQVTQVAATTRDQLTAAMIELKSDADKGWQAFRDGVDAAAQQMDARLAAAGEASERLGTQIASHGDASDALVQRIQAHVEDVEQSLAQLDSDIKASSGLIDRAIADTKGQLATFIDDMESGNASAHQLITHAESLLLALDAVTRELDETLPHALNRMSSHGKTTQNALAQIRPMLDASELVAQSTLSHVNAVKATLETNEERIAAQAASQQALADQFRASLSEADTSLEAMRISGNQFAEQSAQQMASTLASVRETAASTAAIARETIDNLIAGARESLALAASGAIDAAFESEVKAQLAQVEQASLRAVAAAESAADRLTRQLTALVDMSANVEQRALEAEQAIAASDSDTLAKQVGLLTEALKSTAIDVTKILSSDVSDAAWDAYLKGDRGVFSRRAVKLVEGGEAKEILRLYQADDSFHAAVNQFIHDFEAMLRRLIGARDGSAISVTLLSSDIGKLYVALAQAIDRLRS